MTNEYVSTVVTALRCHISDKSCTGCHYHNGVTCEPKRLTDDAADLIEAQQAELDAAADDIKAILSEFRGSSVCTVYCATADCYGRDGDNPCIPTWRGPQKEE